ncbi:hypothetical protein ACEWY4_019781 [Coilia grayii]|uniref:MAM domain-containing protein n=1 Tax=Coilia grayii TaxID=363190 RepID=A0ABD1JAP6_9TELE
MQTRRMTPRRSCKVQCLQFFYYHNGSFSDQLNIWIREFDGADDIKGTRRLISQIQGSPADYWQLHHVPLNATKTFQVEFEGRKGAGSSGGGFSVDDINLSETECPHHTWHIRNFEEKFTIMPNNSFPTIAHYTTPRKDNVAQGRDSFPSSNVSSPDHLRRASERHTSALSVASVEVQSPLTAQQWDGLFPAENSIKRQPRGRGLAKKTRPETQRHKVKMKVLLVLAIAVFTGCNANLFYADEPKPQLEQLTDAFWDYVAQATQTAEDTIQTIRKSHLGQAVSARLTESADVASQYAVTLQNQMTPLAEDVMAKITKEAEVLRERLAQDLTTVKGKLEPYAEDMRAQVLQRVEELKAAVAPYAESLYSESLKTTLLQKSEELKGSLEKSVEELQSQLGPYTEELRQKVQEFQTQLAQRAKTVQQILTPH